MRETGLFSISLVSLCDMVLVWGKRVGGLFTTQPQSVTSVHAMNTESRRDITVNCTRHRAWHQCETAPPQEKRTGIDYNILCIKDSLQPALRD
jgi:hypothetical protein